MKTKTYDNEFFTICGSKITFTSKNGKTFSWSGYHQYKDCKDFMTKLATKLGFVVNIRDLKLGYKEFQEQVGITASNSFKMFSGIMMRKWVEPFKKELNLLAYNVTGKPNTYLVRKMWEMEQVVTQVKKDGICNILPIVLYTGKTPQELKVLLGKSLWKALCSNSKSKNVNIAKLSLSGWVYRSLRDTIETLNTYPSTMLKYAEYRFLEDSYIYAFNILKREYKIKDFIRRERSVVTAVRKISNIFDDTKRLARLTDNNFNNKWSPKKMKEMHDKYSLIYQEREFSKEVFPVLENFPHKSITLGGASATLLDSPKKVYQEGVDMRHCVASYTNRVKGGCYLVYALVCGDYKSTLGITVKSLDCGKSVYTLGQHYGVCNSEVVCEKLSDLASHIIKTLNRE